MLSDMVEVCVRRGSECWRVAVGGVVVVIGWGDSGGGEWWVVSMV